MALEFPCGFPPQELHWTWTPLLRTRYNYSYTSLCFMLIISFLLRLPYTFQIPWSLPTWSPDTVLFREALSPYWKPLGVVWKLRSASKGFWSNHVTHPSQWEGVTAAYVFCKPKCCSWSRHLSTPDLKYMTEVRKSTQLTKYCSLVISSYSTSFTRMKQKLSKIRIFTVSKCAIILFYTVTAAPKELTLVFPYNLRKLVLGKCFSESIEN